MVTSVKLAASHIRLTIQEKKTRRKKKKSIPGSSCRGRKRKRGLHKIERILVCVHTWGAKEVLQKKELTLRNALVGGTIAAFASINFRGSGERPRLLGGGGGEKKGGRVRSGDLGASTIKGARGGRTLL